MSKCGYGSKCARPKWMVSTCFDPRNGLSVLLINHWYIFVAGSRWCMVVPQPPGGPCHAAVLEPLSSSSCTATSGLQRSNNSQGDGMRWHAMAMFETDTDCTGLGKGHTVTYMSCLGDFEDHLEVFVGDEIPNGGCSIQKNHPLSLKVPSLAARVSN